MMDPAHLLLIILGAVVVLMVLANWAQGLNARGEEAGTVRVTNYTHRAIIEGDGRFSFEIVGESHYQDALDKICGGKTPAGHSKKVVAFLYPYKNEHDPKAVAVQIDKLTVGHLSRKHAQELRRQFSNRKEKIFWQADALIVGGWQRDDGDEGHYGVKLDIPTLEH